MHSGVWGSRPDICSQRAKEKLAKSPTNDNTKRDPGIINSGAHDERKPSDLSGGERDGIEPEQGAYDLFPTLGLFAKEAGGEIRDTPATRPGLEGAN